MQFVILHGAFGDINKNWFQYLKRELEALEQTVFLPQFPVDSWDSVTTGGKDYVPKFQKLSIWLKTFKEDILSRLDETEPLCFVGHSLANVFVLHLVEKFNLKLDCALFASPFLEKLHGIWQIDLVNESFYRTDFDFEKLKKNIPVSYSIYSEIDPYVAKKYAFDFAKKTNSQMILVNNGKHFNSDAGFNDFPLLLELCKTRLDYAKVK